MREEIRTMNEKPTPYETPILVKVGEAQDAIRGIYSCGYDTDTLFLASGQEFEEELQKKF
jgi:hypothetical protein